MKKTFSFLLALVLVVSVGMVMAMPAWGSPGQHSTYKLICDVPEVIVACEETRIPVTLKTDELGELGYDGIQLHIKAYPRAGDVTIKLYFWSFSNELYSGEFDLPVDYNKTIYPLVHFSEPGEYTISFSLIEALYGPVINDMTESITISVVEVSEATVACFIATAAYGTPMAREIQILREFRDEYLLTNPLGQALVGLYYGVSPPLADFITEHPSLKPIVRTGLAPAVAISTAAVNTTPAEKAAIIGLVAPRFPWHWPYGQRDGDIELQGLPEGGIAQ